MMSNPKFIEEAKKVFEKANIQITNEKLEKLLLETEEFIYKKSKTFR